MWTGEYRRTHARGGLRYPSDLTDAEWALRCRFCRLPGGVAGLTM